MFVLCIFILFYSIQGVENNDDTKCSRQSNGKILCIGQETIEFNNPEPTAGKTKPSSTTVTNNSRVSKADFSPTIIDACAFLCVIWVLSALVPNKSILFCLRFL